MIALAAEDPGHQVWIPALCLGEATSQLIGTKQRVVLDVLTGSDSDVKIAVYDGATSRRVARIAAEQGIGIDAAHAIATALLYRCYLVSRRWTLAKPGTDHAARRGRGYRAVGRWGDCSG